MVKNVVTLEPEQKNYCLSKCLCNLIFVVFNIFIFAGGITVAVVSALSLWEGASFPVVEAINSNITYFCETLGSNCTGSQVTHISLSASFGIGVGMFVVGICGFILASCYNHGKSVDCLGFFYWLIYTILTLASLGVAILGTIMIANPGLAFKEVQAAIDNQSQEDRDKFYAEVAKFAQIFCIAGWTTFAVLVVVAVSGGCLLRISRKATDANNDRTQKLYTNEASVNYVGNTV